MIAWGWLIPALCLAGALGWVGALLILTPELSRMATKVSRLEQQLRWYEWTRDAGYQTGGNRRGPV